MILPDNETRIDLLNNEAIAATIIALLQAQRAHPVTVGVHGDWGAGKSSILEMIEAGLGGSGDVLCLKFNSWRFQGFEDAKIALIEGVVTGLLEKRPVLTRATEGVKDLFARIDWLKVAKHAGGLAFTAFTGMPTPDQISAITNGLQHILADPAKLATKENISAAIEGVKSVIKPAEAKNVPEEIAEFRKAFDKLLKDAGIKQLVVLVDDLDRCLPDTAIETLEAIRLFVFTSGTAFVVAADEAMIEYSVRKHFPELPETTGPRDYARNYLEKLIQIPFRIPALGETETRIYVTLLLIGAELGEADEQYAKLIAVARERLKRPWESAPLDFAAIKAALGDVKPAVQNAVTLSDQIGPILASGAKGNPRQIKRFLNTLLLRQQTATARGYGNDVKLPVLARLMLAERFIPRLFDQIAFAAAAHPKGYCDDLVALEAATGEKATADTKVGKAKESGDVAESALVTEWLASPQIKAWSQVPPPLANVDLRPYLFVTKDRKDYFGAASALGHLAGVVEKLLGPKLAVQSLDADLKLLKEPEAAQVFEALRSRIMGEDSFMTAPLGIDGLSVLVKTHPVLQTNLLDFLGALPVERCGAWPVSGWQGVVTDQAAATRLTNLIEEWATSGKKSPLANAAIAARKMKSRSA
ncbi:Qat anti-phage system ATPase QatA [Bradyrhizobium arachidis]|uniref:NTPase KAP n=1 Tax=Bradyrhizobium arachidis TaxID=858423 RepID=A0AAE7TL06_9BRAD|nr:Qat anti-phage system ATPase QatA [Bradyrhizobium arachidis]QOZ71889.1 NTPase KAP [Bradyrhizobium arachidis]SFV14493.1 Predicted P-loop ATPase, KAP-like [Bradyrhizobium arachidis]